MSGKYLLLVFLLLLLSCEKGQDINDTVIKFYGDALEDIGFSIAPADNGYLIAGQFTDVARTNGNIIDSKNSVKKMGIIKTGFDGNTLWKKSYGGTLEASGSKVLVLDDGSVICIGYVVNASTLKDIFVVKTDATGKTLTEKIFAIEGNQYGTDIIKTQDGFMILGSSDLKRDPATGDLGNEAGKKDILVLRINADNLELVGNTSIIPHGFPGNDEGVSIKADVNGGFIIVGNTDRSDKPKQEQDGSNLLIIRITSDGTLLESRILGGTQNEYAADIETIDYGYVIAGTLGIEGTKQSGYIWKIPVNINSEAVQSREIDIDPSSDTKPSFSIKAMAKYKTNSLILAGQTGPGSSADMLIIVTDTDGNLISGKKKKLVVQEVRLLLMLCRMPMKIF